MHLAPIDWIILVAYFVVSAGIGLCYVRRGGKSTKDFFVSGRDLPWWLAGTSMVATSFSSDTPLYVTGVVRKFGLWKNWEWWSFAIGGMLAVFFMARLWRRTEVITDVEFTELRYSGRSAAILRGFRGIYLAFFINSIAMVWVILAMYKFFDVAFGMNRWQALIVSSVITVAYSALSGLWGVVVTDLIQFLVAMFGSIALAAICVGKVGGLTALRETATAASPLKESLTRFYPAFPEGVSPFCSGFWTPAVTGFLTYVVVQWWANKNSDGGSVIIQRMLACKDERDSLLATLWFNIANYAVRTWPWILVALASIVAYPTLTNAPKGVDDESVYIRMFIDYLPKGLLGLMLASFFAAFMSTISTHINLGSAYFVNDIYRRFLVTRAKEDHYVLIARIASVAFMLLSALLAINAKSIGGIFRFMLAFSAGIGIVYILRWFWWRVNAWTEISAMLASALVAVLLYALPKRADGSPLLTPQETLLATTAVSLAVSLVCTFLTAPVEEEKLIEFYRRVRPPGFWGPIAAKVPLPDSVRTAYLRDLANWVAGVALVLGATFSIGKFCLGLWQGGVAYLVAAVAGALVIHRNLSTHPITEKA